MRRSILLGLVLFFWPAGAWADEVPLESLVRRAHAVVEAQVVVREASHEGRTLRFPALEVLQVLLGNPPREIPLQLSASFEPPLHEPAVWFLVRGSRGWVPLGHDPSRELRDSDWIRTLLEVRAEPRAHLASQNPTRVRAALVLLTPGPQDRARLQELLLHPTFDLRLQAAVTWGRLDREAALDWLFESWTLGDAMRFAQVRRAVETLLGRRVALPVHTAWQRQRAVEVYRLAADLTGVHRARALQRLPGLSRAAATGSGAWAVEALALYPPELALPGLAEALGNPEEAVVGRALALLEEALAHPGPALRRAAASAAGSTARARLAGLSRRTFSSPEVGEMVRLQAGELMARLRVLGARPPSADAP
jgi:hypothetical protein